MTHKTRKIILLLFLVAFSLTAPIVILYTAGYRYSWKKTKFEKTGMIHLESIPGAAQVFINGKLQQRTTPDSFPRLLPDEYDVRIEKRGYLPWEKMLEVRSSETTFAQEIRLFSDTMPRLLTEADVEQAAVFGKNGTVTMLVKSHDWQELILVRDGKALPTPLARFSGETLTDAALSWSPDGKYVLLQSPPEEPVRVFLYPVTSANGEPFAIHEALAKITKSDEKVRLRIRWNSDGSMLSALTEDGAFIIHPDDQTIDQVPASMRAQDVATGEGAVYLLRPARSEQAVASGSVDADAVDLTRIPFADARSSEIVASLPKGDYRFVDITARYLIVSDRGSGKLLLISPKNGAVLAKLVGESVRWEKAPGKGRLLVWNGFELSIFNPASGTAELVTRVGSTITDCRWHPAGTSVIFSTATGIFASELDDRGTRNTYELIRFPSVKAFDVDADGTYFYFVGAAGNQKGLYERML